MTPNRYSLVHSPWLVSMVPRNALVGLFAVALLFPFSGSDLFAADISGALEYHENCARCHGADATGNAEKMHKPGYYPKDLTHISRNHGGKFPRQEIYDIIDGGKRLPGHYDFDSPMPLWGLRFQVKGREYSKESEAAVKRRIDALLDYLETTQKNSNRRMCGFALIVRRPKNRAVESGTSLPKFHHSSKKETLSEKRDTSTPGITSVGANRHDRACDL